MVNVSIFKLIKGGIKKRMARKPEVGSEEKETEDEKKEEPAIAPKENTISEQEIIDMANGHLARASQLLEFLKNSKVS